MECQDRERITRNWRHMVVLAIVVVVMTVGSAAAGPAQAPGKPVLPQVKKPLPPPAAAALLNRDLRAAIKVVEKSRVACQTGNTLVSLLRLVDDNVTVGRRSAAAGLLKVIIEELQTMKQGGLLSAEQQEAFSGRLASIAERVGSGWTTNASRPKPWPPLPACSADAGVGVVGGVSPLTAHKITSILLKVTFKAVETITSMYGLEFPWEDNGIKSLVSEELEEDFYWTVMDLLDGLGADLDNFIGWETCCSATAPDSVNIAWGAAQADFVTLHGVFQDPRCQVELAPLFAQYENLYITLLREAVLYGKNWGMDQTAIDHAAEMLTASIVDARQYVYGGGTYGDGVYKMGLSQLDDPDNPEKNFEARNAYERDMRLNVLDYADAWPDMDPTTHSFGNPGFALTRMVYSDLVGHTDGANTFAAPANADYPLTKLTSWAKVEYDPEDRKDEWWLTAIQAENPPLPSWPTGDTAFTPDPVTGAPPSQNSWSFGPGTSLGSIVQVDAEPWRVGLAYKYIIQSVRLHFANGATPETNPFYDRTLGPGVSTFYYPDHVLATAKIMGPFGWSKGNATGDGIVFGFRYGDSYYPSGLVKNVSAGKCIDLQGWALGLPAVIYPCRTTASEAQDWTYNSTTMELTSSGGEADGGTRCLEAAGTAVQIQACSGAAAQKWTINSNKTILNPSQPTRCLAITTADNNASLQLATCNGTTAQQWTTPWIVRQPGTIQAGPGITGACIEVKDGARTEGQPAQMAACVTDVWRQQWNYDETSRAVQAFGGTMCLTQPAGTSAVVIGACTGDASQQWTMGTDTIKQDQSGLCLYRSATTAGTPLTVGACGTSGTQWHWPLR